MLIFILLSPLVSTGVQASAHPNWTGVAAVAASASDVTAVPVATAGPCPSPMCDAIMAFLVLLFFMTFVVAITQMPLLMIVLRSVDEEERSFALGMQ
jgi:organic anion transporter 3A